MIHLVKTGSGSGPKRAIGLCASFLSGCLLVAVTGCLLVAVIGCQPQPPMIETAPQALPAKSSADTEEQSMNAPAAPDDDSQLTAAGESAAETKPQTEYNSLTPQEARVILHKGTERAFTGEYTKLHDPGTFVCRRCNAPLYRSDDKFDSHCGWPSFDAEIAGAVKQLPDEDGQRTEIICNNCDGHLGHVFFGEGFTKKNTRHCVNSVSMRFYAKGKPLPPVVPRPKTP
ncbi:MAG: methionine-R-sulfoxide reductase [Planctomycetota bacterium]